LHEIHLVAPVLVSVGRDVVHRVGLHFRAVEASRRAVSHSVDVRGRC
jgi:hypothetical protein